MTIDTLNALTVADALTAIERFRGLRVAVVGETIIDEYAYCDPMGKSGKEPMLVMRFRDVEVQAGGVLAIANHLAEFTDHVTVFSALGEHDRREQFVRAALKPAIRAEFVTAKGQATIVKRRYLDGYSLAKMFGVYHMSDDVLPAEAEEEFLAKLANPAGGVDSFDLVIVADYGHGLITKRAVDLLVSRARFLAINTQLNAANTGYHTLSKYPRADFACVHEGELRLDARELRAPVEELMNAAAARLGAGHVMVTLGKNGTVLRAPTGEFHRCPSLASTVVERVGAGDAVLSISALAAASAADPELVGILGNLAGAQAVQVVGNRSSISASRLRDALRFVLPVRHAESELNEHARPPADERRVAP